MKLLRLKITDPSGFRSLPSGFEHHFRTEWTLQEELGKLDGFVPFVCAGPNGSGKSPDDFLRTLAKQTLKNPLAEANFLKLPFLEACHAKGVF
ncbi:hypothetical protein ACVIWV_007120 [Bradyrhizobium diazoefficiens]